MLKNEKKKLLKEFNETVEATSGEMGYWEPLSWHRGLRESYTILKNILEDFK